MSFYILRCDKCGDLTDKCISRGMLDQIKIMHEKVNPSHKAEVVLVVDIEKKRKEE